MSYKTSGFDNLMYREGLPEAPAELTEADSSARISSLTGSSVAGGKTSSSDGKMEIDWDSGTITISDGAHPRILIGYQKGGFLTD